MKIAQRHLPTQFAAAKQRLLVTALQQDWGLRPVQLWLRRDRTPAVLRKLAKS